MNNNAYWMSKVDKQSEVIKRYQHDYRIMMREIELLKAEKKKLETKIKELKETGQ